MSSGGSWIGQYAGLTFRATPSASLALGNDGNLNNTLELAELAGEPATGGGAIGAPSDTDVLTALFARPVMASAGAGGPEDAGPGIEAGAMAALPLGPGAYSLGFMDEPALYAARDPPGV